MALNIDSTVAIAAKVTGENNIRRLGNSMQGVEGKVKNLKGSITALSGALKVFGGVLVIGGIKSFADSALQLADEMGKASTRTSVAANDLLAFANAGKLADVSQKTLINGLTKLNVNAVAAAEGNQELAKRFEQLGVDVKGADGQIRATDELFKDLADRFADLPDGAEKAAAAVSIFGKSGAELITLLNGGSASLEEFNYKLSDDFAPRAELFNDTLTKIGFQFQGFQLQLMDALLPALQAILEVFGELFATDNDWTALFGVIEGGLRGVSIFIYSTIKLVDEFVRAIAGGFDVIGKAIKGDFIGAGKAALDYYKNFGSRFQKNIESIGKLATGTAAAPTKVKRTGTFDLRDLREETKATNDAAKASKAKADADAKAAAELKKLNDEKEAALQASISQLQASEAALALAKETDPILRMQLEYEEEARKLSEEKTAAINNAKSEQEKANLTLAYNNELTALAVTHQRDLKKAIDETTTSFNKSFMAQIRDFQEELEDFGGAVGDAVVGAFEGMTDALTEFVTTGKANFTDLANSIINDLVRIAIQQAIVAPLLGALFPSGSGSTVTAFTPLAVAANGKVFGQNGIKPFARGGIVNQPTLFPFANGTGLMGEAGPEAIMPLRRGADGRLGVEASNGGVGNVTVNVDASGSSVQGDSAQANNLGAALGAAVQAELIKQKRPGGLLA